MSHFLNKCILHHRRVVMVEEEVEVEAEAEVLGRRPRGRAVRGGR